jgi:hypothetical protein
MDKPYADIPAAGRHRGSQTGTETGSSVRAPEPLDPRQAQGHPVAITYQHLVSEAQGTHRLRRISSAHTPEPVRGYTEMGRYTSIGELRRVLDQFRDQQRFVVFENTATGEVYYDDESNVHDNWTGDGQFDVVTVFEDENQAAAYIDERQKRKA